MIPVRALRAAQAARLLQELYAIRTRIHESKVQASSKIRGPKRERREMQLGGTNVIYFSKFHRLTNFCASSEAYELENCFGERKVATPQHPGQTWERAATERPWPRKTSRKRLVIRVSWPAVHAFSAYNITTVASQNLRNGFGFLP